MAAEGQRVRLWLSRRKRLSTLLLSLTSLCCGLGWPCAGRSVLGSIPRFCGYGLLGLQRRRRSASHSRFMSMGSNTLRSADPYIGLFDGPDAIGVLDTIRLQSEQPANIFESECCHVELLGPQRGGKRNARSTPGTNAVHGKACRSDGKEERPEWRRAAGRSDRSQKVRSCCRCCKRPFENNRSTPGIQ